MLDQGQQLALEVVGQVRNGRFVEHLPAELPAEGQFITVYLAIEAQPVAQWRIQRLLTAAAFGGRGQQRALTGIETAVELAKVVERDAWCLQGAEAGPCLRRAQVAQGAIAKAFVGDCPQLFLDLLDGVAKVGGRHELDREQAGEPTHRAGQVDVIEQVFAAMTFQFDQAVRGAGPAADDTCQGRQQQVVNLRAIGLGRLLQQLFCLPGVEVGMQRVAVAIIQAAMGTFAWQVGRVGVELRQPVVQFVLGRLVLRAALQALGPGLDRTGAGRQLHRLLVADLLIGVLQVFKKNPPGHAIHCQVVDHQQQALGTVSQVDQQGTDQRTVLQVEAALGLIAQVRQLLGGGVNLLQLPVDHWPVLGAPAAGVLLKAQTQGVVVLNHRVQRLLQCLGHQRLRRLEQYRLVPVMALRDRRFKKHLVNRQQRERAGGWSLVDHLGTCADTGHAGQALHGLVLEQFLGCKGDALLAGAADHLDGDDGVTAQFEEIVVQADAFQFQHVLPDGGDLLFQRALRRHVGFLQQVCIGFRQCLAVQFAVGAQGQLVEEDQLGRHHVVGQVFAQAVFDVAAQVCGVTGLSGHGVGD